MTTAHERREQVRAEERAERRNTDDFTNAARKSAEQTHAIDPRYIGQSTRDQMNAHIKGWYAARGHLAEQEPTDAEVLAALNADYALRYGGRNVPAESLEPYGDEHVQIMRAALVAARAVRQEKR